MNIEGTAHFNNEASCNIIIKTILKRGYEDIKSYVSSTSCIYTVQTKPTIVCIAYITHTHTHAHQYKKYKQKIINTLYKQKKSLLYTNGYRCIFTHIDTYLYIDIF